MLKKMLEQTELARLVLLEYLKDPEVQGAKYGRSLTIFVQMLAVQRPDGVNWEAVYDQPALFEDALLRAIATVQAEYNLTRSFLGGSAMRL
jgi:hypothetical protein